MWLVCMLSLDGLLVTFPVKEKTRQHSSCSISENKICSDFSFFFHIWNPKTTCLWCNQTGDRWCNHEEEEQSECTRNRCFVPLETEFAEVHSLRSGRDKYKHWNPLIRATRDTWAASSPESSPEPSILIVPSAVPSSSGCGVWAAASHWWTPECSCMDRSLCLRHAQGGRSYTHHAFTSSWCASLRSCLFCL